MTPLPEGSRADAKGRELYRRADELKPLHWEALLLREPAEASRAAGALWDGTAFLLEVLGRRLRVDLNLRTVQFERQPEAEVGFERALVAVTYLGGAVEAPKRGDWVAFRELPGGDAFFRGPHSVATRRLERAFGDRPADLETAAVRLGGRAVSGADASAELPALPFIPLKVLVWKATAEFPARASLLTDGRAHLHLPLAVLWALTNVAIGDLTTATT